MKKHLLILLITCMGLQVKAQKWELSLQGGATFSHFTGNAATADAGFFEMHAPDSRQYYVTDNPNGKKLAFGYSGGLQAQFVSKGGFIAGLGAGYELLRSKANVNRIYPNVPYLLYIYLPPSTPAKGSVHLSNRFINLSPYVGYRFKFKTTSLDLLPGADIALPVSSHENGIASTDTQNYTVDNQLTKQLTDVRLKFGAHLNYQQWSINAAYAHGIFNYDRHFVGATPKLYSELYNLGIGYRLF